MPGGIYRFQVGKFSCMAINDVDGGDVSCNCLLIQTGELRVLIDTGSGDTMPSPPRLVGQLRAAGISPDEIDVVALSHADVAQAATTREQLFAQAAGAQCLLMAYHAAFPGLGYVVQNTSGWQWTPFNTRT